MRGLTIEQLQRTLTSFLRHGRGSFDLARMYSDIENQGTVRDHPFAAPPNPNPPRWCKCGRCGDMGTGRARENVCCQQDQCVTTEEYLRATCLDHNVLTLTIRLHADYMSERLNYRANGFRKAAYRQYILGRYGYLGKGTRRIAPSCVVRCVRHWFPAPDGRYMGYKSE